MKYNDLQLFNRNDDVILREDVRHVRQLMSENQKAMLSLIKAMTSMQDEMTQLGSAICGLTGHASSCQAHSSTDGMKLMTVGGRHNDWQCSVTEEGGVQTTDKGDKQTARRGPFAALRASVRKKRDLTFRRSDSSV